MAVRPSRIIECTRCTGVLLRYRFRVYPTRPQQAMLARTFGCVRTVWNDAVAARNAAFRQGLPFPSTAALDKTLITEAKRTREREWLGDVSTVPLQQVLRDCHAAYKNYFDAVSGKRAGQRVGPPRFKRRVGTQAARFTRRGFALRPNGRLYLAKIGELKVAWSRELPSDPSSVTAIRSSTGKYYVSFVVSVDDGAEVMEPLSDPAAETGIDLGLKDFAVLRGGRVIENPQFFRHLERKLKKSQRAFSRKKKGSVNQSKARLKLALIHEKIKHSRLDWIDKQVKVLVGENQALYVEDLNVRGLCRGRAAKSVQDAAWGMFLTRLESKAARAGRTFVCIDRYFPSTRMCSVCGALTGPRGLESLKVRKWECRCGASHDRDANAEINIRREGGRLVAEGLPDT